MTVYLITMGVILLIAMLLCIAYLLYRDAEHRRAIHGVREDLLTVKMQKQQLHREHKERLDKLDSVTTEALDLLNTLSKQVLKLAQRQ